MFCVNEVKVCSSDYKLLNEIVIDFIKYLKNSKEQK